jgi:hypothetical protein
MSQDIHENLINFAYKSDASDILLKKIAELQNTLDAARQNSKRNEKAIEFYESVIAAMKYAFSSLVGLEQMFKQNIFLQSENTFLKQHLHYCQNELNKYKTVEELIVTGDFDKVNNSVSDYLKNKLPNEQ